MSRSDASTPPPKAPPQARRTILLVDDDPQILQILAVWLERAGWRTIRATDGRASLELYEHERPAVVMLDLSMPGLSGMEVLRMLRERDPDATVLMLTGTGDVATAVEAMRLGAENFLSKPPQPDHLVAAVERAFEKAKLRRRNRVLAEQPARDGGLASLGESAPMRDLARQVELLADGTAPILLTGETGSGKGWVARLIHAESPRRGGPFVSVNCAGLSASFLDTELFGHEKGAFTDAKMAKPGLFEVADGGTLLLDEIGDLSPELQPKLLSVLETQSFRRLGGTREVHVDVRLIAATHVDLAAAVRDQRFRQDLFYRLAVLPVRVPSLRERGADEVAEMAVRLLADLRRQLGRGPTSISPQALERIVAHAWPGNVRELRNVLERALLIGATDSELAPGHLPVELRAPTTPTPPPPPPLPPRSPAAPTPGDLTLAATELAHIRRVIELAGGNRARAAKMLGISRQTLYTRLNEHAQDEI